MLRNNSSTYSFNKNLSHLFRKTSSKISLNTGYQPSGMDC